MTTYISDTHALVWLLEGDPQLSPSALQAFSDASAQVVVPTIVLAEIQFLYTRQRIATDLQQVMNHIRRTQNVRVYPLDELVVERMPSTLRIHDAIIVATGIVFRDVFHFPTSLITRDAQIRGCGLLNTIW